MKIKNLNENSNRFQLLGAIFAKFPDLSSEDEDYLNNLTTDELVSEIKNRGWENILEAFTVHDNEMNWTSYGKSNYRPSLDVDVRKTADGYEGKWHFEDDSAYTPITMKDDKRFSFGGWGYSLDNVVTDDVISKRKQMFDASKDHLSRADIAGYLRSKGFEDVNHRINESAQKKHTLSEYWDKIEDTPYYKVASKSVMDSDGFWTEYTMYYNEDEDNYFFIFGDSDLYGPDPDYADWECDTNDEAVEWYNNYNGFEDEEDIEESLEFTRDELISKFGTDNVDLINAGREEERRVSLKEPSNVFEESSEFDARPGQEVTFSTEGMTEIPDVNSHFRVGPLTGTCIERTNDSVKMRVEGNSFLHEKLTISEDLFDDVELPAASPDPEIPEVAVESEPSKETPDQGPEFGIADLLNNLISSNWNLNSSYSELIVNAESNNMSDIANIVKDISAEVNNHIGKLQAALSTICPSVENISVGEEEATQQLEQQSEEITEDISPEEKASLEKRGTISQKTRNKLNKIVSKYNGYHEPAEIRNMWEELMNENVEVEMISGYGQQAADGGRSWTVGWSLEGIPVMNSMFVYAVYEPQDSTRNEYTIYFS